MNVPASPDVFRALFDESSDGLFIADASGRYVAVNPRGCELTGYTAGELAGLTRADVLAPGASDVLLRKDRTSIEVEITDRTLEAGRRLDIMRDVSDRRRTEDVLRFRTEAIDTSINGVAFAGLDGRIQYANASLLRMWEFESEADVIGREVVSLAASAEAAGDIVRSLLRQGRWIGEAVARRKTGESFAVEVSARLLTDAAGVPRAMMASCIDLTAKKNAEVERLRLERQLVQARKLESVGRLAGGVAHDFNNMLSVIIGRSELALSRMEPSHPVCADIAAVQHAAEKSAALTRQLLTFARKQPAERTMLDLNGIVDANLALLRRIVGNHIEMAWLPSDGLWPIEAEPTHIDQILANLVGNARDAMSVGRITIATANEVVEQTAGGGSMDIAPGPYVVLEVTDTGHGMDDETQARLFEPFYTTKAQDRGTGLGLATVHNIVRQAGGGIRVVTAVGRGTTFRIYLPAFPTGVGRTLPVPVQRSA
jgi:PAS domain S-box-containing protein